MQPATEIRNERSAGELYWREYWIEAGALATFMLAACVFGVLLEHPSSAAHQSIDAPLLRRALMGAAMGLTAVAIISSHWGQRSGAHMNPALTLTYWALGKIRSRDALLYVAFQFLGGAAGVAAAAAVIGPPLGDAAVDFVATRPGPDGAGAAFAAELGISTLLMGTVLVTSNSPRLAHSTPLFAGALVALYITLETPLSGMSVNPARTLASVRDVAQGAVEVVRGKLRPASRTPLNPDAIGPHRRLDWIRFDLDEAKEVKRHLGGKLNDVVLAAVAGALRRYLRARRVPVVDLDFRVVVPVNTRPVSAQSTLGNRVAPMLARLPLENRDARGRLRQVAETSRALKDSRQVQAIGLFEDLANWANAALISALVRRATRWWSGNMIVTNIHGPPFPFYLLGARVLECYPMIPLLANQAVSIAILSYGGGLHWGFNSDWDAVPDLHDLVQCVVDEFAALEQAAAQESVTA